MSQAKTAFFNGLSNIFALPRLSLPLILSLGLTLAAVISVITIASTLLLKPLPDINEKDLYKLDLTMQFTPTLSFSFLGDIRRLAFLEQTLPEGVEAGFLSNSTATVNINSNTHEVTRFDASAGMLEVLQLPLVKGQASTAQDSGEGVWISRSLWLNAFSGAEDITGKTVQIGERAWPVMGVVTDFTSVEFSNGGALENSQIWLFQSFADAMLLPEQLNAEFGTQVFARGPENLVPTTDAIESWFTNYIETEVAVPEQVEFVLSKPHAGHKLLYRDAFVGDSYTLVTVLLVAMASLLIMACLNLLNMFIAHYQSRGKEFAIHLCMGASPRKLQKLIFIENTPLFAVATVTGLLAAAWLLRFLPDLAGDSLVMSNNIKIDATSVIVAIVVVALINLVFSLLTTSHIKHEHLATSLSASGKGGPVQQDQKLSRALMVLQIILACTLLSAAMVSVKKSYQTAYGDLGFDFANAYEVNIGYNDTDWQLALEQYEEYRGSELYSLKDNLKQRLSSLPGKVLLAPTLPLSNNVAFSVINDTENNRGEITFMRKIWSEGYFDAFGIEVLAGRDMTADDIDNNRIVVAKDFAEIYHSETNWQDIVGREIRFGSDDNNIFTVVGVVSPVKSSVSTTLEISAPAIYFTNPMNRGPLGALIVLEQGQQLTESQVVEAIGSLDPRLGRITLTSLSERWEESTYASRLNMYVVGVLALLTLGLAAIGLSGLSQMNAAQQRYEMAVRQAVGAKRKSLLNYLLKDSIWILVAGSLVGFLVAIGAYNGLAALWQDTPPFDWTAMVASSVVLAIAMLFSTALPCWRAINNEPMQVLREL